MKNIALTNFLLFIVACGPEAPMFERQYIILNSSSHPIFLEFYRDGQPSLFNATALSMSQQLEGSILSRSGGSWESLSQSNNLRLPSTSFETDSVVIVFNNEKKATYTI
ncbi:hypothetical protein KIM67_17070 [Flagellimonas sp. 389]|uniref:hypothetical protein n=1 Tax=Flagellimonas sp. 389 TaxID=2835862 RepID=UPI001BD66ED4|nr:hypothetical protein [Flagellimonas sp. 389]MBS9464137.1 hypothetical protein [Flagellimonas sp. 389]